MESSNPESNPGLVGSTVLKVLEEYEFPIKCIYFYASEKSKGKECSYNGKRYKVELLSPKSFNNVDFVFFCAGSDVSKTWVPIVLL